MIIERERERKREMNIDGSLGKVGAFLEFMEFMECISEKVSETWLVF